MKALLYLIFPAVLLVGYGKSWDQQYEEWIKDPVPYGGLKVLQKIKKAKDSGATVLIFFRNNISDITPLAGLTNLTTLWLTHNNISDLTPLAGLTNLTTLWLAGNNTSDLTPLAGLTNLTELRLVRINITDLTPLAGLTNLTELYLDGNPISASQKAMLEVALSNTTIYW